MSPLGPYDAAAFARISQDLLAQPVMEQTLQKVVEVAVESIQGCDFAGVCLRQGRTVDTRASSNPIVVLLDRLQPELGGGPALDAVFVQDTYVIDDMNRETRWPNWAPRAAEQGVLSVLSVRLSTATQVLGGLNLYSKALFAYDQDQILTANIYAIHASNAIAAAIETDGLATGMRTRRLIGMAQGLLIQRYELSEEQSFQYLARISQDTNVKLREVAAKLIAQATEHGRLP